MKINDWEYDTWAQVARHKVISAEQREKSRSHAKYCFELRLRAIKMVSCCVYEVFSVAAADAQHSLINILIWSESSPYLFI